MNWKSAHALENWQLETTGESDAACHDGVGNNLFSTEDELVQHSETLRINKRVSLSDPFITAGDRAYLIGAQHGGFPDIGWHLPGEMGGIWTHPIKLLDGFWLGVDGHWLSEAIEYRGEAFSTTHVYESHNGLAIERRQFVPDGEPAVVVRYDFASTTLDRLTVRLLARSDLRSVWSPGGLAIEGQDQAMYSDELDAWICRTDLQEWTAVVGAIGQRSTGRQESRNLWGPERTQGNGVSIAMDFDVNVGPGIQSQLTFVVCGSLTGKDDACATLERVRENAFCQWDVKAVRYAALLQQSLMTVPDMSLQRAWDWVKCDYDWLLRDLPDVGRGLGGGVDDYPWWFGCDASYAVLGALTLGQHEPATATLDLLRVLSTRANGNSGRVIHECTTKGEVVGRGSVQETPHYVSAVWETFRWTGDVDFLRRSYDFCRRGLLGWVLDDCCHGGLLPYGYGITERDGFDLQCVDTATATSSALDALAGMAGVLGDEPVAAHCRLLASEARTQVEREFWMEEEGLYGDMIATPAEMASRLRQWLSDEEGLYYRSDNREKTYLAGLLDRADSDPQPDRKRPWLLKNWIVICPLEARLARPDRAERTLNRVESAEFTGADGMYISGSDSANTMSINTGVLAVAELAYGRVEQGLRYVHKLTNSLDRHMPGAISELLPGGGCFVQAWSGYGVAWPVVAHLFGLRPDAHGKCLSLEPCFPPEWRDVRLANVRIGHAAFDFEWDGTQLLVTVSETGWLVDSCTVPVRIEVRDA